MDSVKAPLGHLMSVSSLETSHQGGYVAAPEVRRAAGFDIYGIASLRRYKHLFLSAIALLALTASGAQKNPPAKPINLNTATVEELEQLPGVGPVIAKDIIQFRQKSGPFRSVNDLLAIRRITKARLEKLCPYVTIGTPMPKPHPSAPATPPAPRSQ